MVALIMAMQYSPFRLPILIAMSTGMRKSEILGLKWCDFDRIRNILSVRRSLSQIPGKVFAKDTKSGRPRVVPIPASLALILTGHKQEQESQGIYKPDGWICARENGDMLTPRAFGQAFHRLKTTHNFDFTLHGLRHTQATMLIAAGVPVKIVSERLGHATSSITQDIYAHVLPHMQERAVTVVDSIITPLLQAQK
jgi:integrase